MRRFLKALSSHRLSPGVLTGMQVQCVVTAGMQSLGIIEVTPGQQLGVAFILLLMDVVMYRYSRQESAVA